MLDTLPDSLILSVVKYLDWKDVTSLAQCSASLRAVCQDDLLWRDLFHHHFRLSPYFPEPIANENWRSEFIRLIDETPILETEVLTEHTDQVLHVSFSPDGTRFATTAKDALVNVVPSLRTIQREMRDV